MTAMAVEASGSFGVESGLLQDAKGMPFAGWPIAEQTSQQLR